MASSAMMGLLGFAGGVSGAIGDIGEEQRKWNMKQQEAKAELERKQNFERFQHSLKGSGMVDESGYELTREEKEKRGALGGLRSKAEHTAEVTAKANQDARDASKADQPSQSVDVTDPDNPRVLTNRELEEAQKDPNRKIRSVMGYEKDQAQGKQEDKLDVSDIKEVKKQVVKIAQDTEASEAEKTQKLAAIGDTYGAPTAEVKVAQIRNPIINQIIEAQNSKNISRMQAEDMAKKYLEGIKRKKKATKEEIAAEAARIIKIVQDSGRLKEATGPNIVFGQAGAGW